MTRLTLERKQDEIFQAVQGLSTGPENVVLKSTLLKAGHLFKQNKPLKALEILAQGAKEITPEAIGSDIHILLIRAWALGGAFYALKGGVLPRKMVEAELGVCHFLGAIRHARETGLGHVAKELIEFTLTKKGGGPLNSEEVDAFEGLRIMIELGDIQDPFEGWKALTVEISKVWPEGVSAVEAVREQRR